MVEAVCGVLVIIAAFFFGYHTGYERGRDDKQFDKATRKIIVTRRLN